MLVVDGEDVADVPELSDEVRVALTDIAGVSREGLLAMSVAVGLQVMAELMDDEVTATVGAKHARLADPPRCGTRARPGRWCWAAARSPSADPARARPMAARSSSRPTPRSPMTISSSRWCSNACWRGWRPAGNRAAVEPVGAAVEQAATATSKSAVSRRFVTRTARELERLMARDLSELDVAALMVDGICFADSCCVVALAITADGTKVPVGLWLGDTENATVVRSLLADLVARGLDAAGGLLVVHRWRQGVGRGGASRVR